LQQGKYGLASNFIILPRETAGLNFRRLCGMNKVSRKYSTLVFPIIKEVILRRLKQARFLLIPIILMLFLFSLTSDVRGRHQSPGKSHGEEAFYINWKRYYTHDELTEIYRAMVNKFPGLVKLVSTGKSVQGRDLWLLEITNFKTGVPITKPGVYVDGAIHGNEVQGIMCALYTGWYLLTRYGNDAYVTQLMDTRAFYIKPAVNVDAAHSFVAEPNTPHHPRWNFRPVDNDGDGKFDEDPEEDIDKNNEISLMRRRNPHGRWKIGSDPRLMVRCEPGEPAGGWEMLGYEGIDNDGDGRVNEDIPGGVDLARNFSARWSISAGHPYPLSEPETRSTADYLMQHKNVGVIVHHHNAGRLIMIAAGPYERREPRRSPFSRGGKYPTDVDKKMERLRSIQVPNERIGDWRSYVTLTRRGVEITGYRPVVGGGAGQFSAWAYEHYGVYCFLMELWSIPADFNEDGRVDAEERLKWVDREFHGEGWVDWKPFKHPTYGNIDIGGTYKKFVRRATPGKYLEQQAVKMNDWTLYLAYNLPLIEVSRLKVTSGQAFDAIGQGKISQQGSQYVISTGTAAAPGILAWLEVDIENKRMLPTKSQMALKLKLLPKDTLQLKGKGLEVLGYMELDRNRLPKKFINKKIAEFDRIEGYGTKRVRFLVRAKKNTTVNAVFTSIRGGTAGKSVSLHAGS
jgi:hypothetical protein